MYVKDPCLAFGDSHGDAVAGLGIRNVKCVVIEIDLA